MMHYILPHVTNEIANAEPKLVTFSVCTEENDTFQNYSDICGHHYQLKAKTGKFPSRSNAASKNPLSTGSKLEINPSLVGTIDDDLFSFDLRDAFSFVNQIDGAGFVGDFDAGHVVDHKVFSG